MTARRWLSHTAHIMSPERSHQLRTHAPPPRGAQLAEDLRTLPARRVREAAPEDVQCVQQCGSMLRRV
eukprot:scaffold57895_cov62-Phaeocystis_antarctica.AAC.6